MRKEHPREGASSRRLDASMSVKDEEQRRCDWVYAAIERHPRLPSLDDNEYGMSVESIAVLAVRRQARPYDFPVSVGNRGLSGKERPCFNGPRDGSRLHRIHIIDC